MTLDGALCDDREELDRGLVSVFPNDQHGRPVVWVGRVGCTASTTYDRDSFLRSLWYVFHAVSMNSPENQKKGYVMIINLKDYIPHKSADRIGAKKAFIYIREAWCPLMKAYHAAYGSNKKQPPSLSSRPFERCRDRTSDCVLSITTALIVTTWRACRRRTG